MSANVRSEVPFRVVALDIDGTVLNSAQRVTEELRAVLARLAARGVRTVLCTGRRWAKTLPVLKELRHGHPVVVCSGGSLVKNADDGSTLRTVPLPHETARSAARLMRRSGLVPMLLYDRSVGAHDLMLAESDRAAALLLPYADESVETWEWYAGDYPDRAERPLACYAVDDTERADRGLACLREGLGETAIVNSLVLSRFTSAQSALEAHDPCATKWHALAWLLGEWGLDGEQVVAIGDDVNDVPMLRAAGLSFAMGNAPDEVKAAADAVTGSNDENGVATALADVFGL